MGDGNLLGNGISAKNIFVENSSFRGVANFGHSGTVVPICCANGISLVESVTLPCPYFIVCFR